MHSQLVRSRVFQMLAVMCVAATASGAEHHWNVADGFYSNALNWDPTSVPIFSDSVYVGVQVPAATVWINGTALAHTVVIRNQSQLSQLNASSFLRTHQLYIEPGSSVNVVGSGPSLDLEVIDGGILADGEIHANGTLALDGANVEMVRLTDSGAGTGAVSGHGTITATSGSLSVFSGTLRPEGGTLLMQGGFYELDAAGALGIDAAAGGELIMAASLFGPYSGTLDIAPGGRVVFTNGDVDTLVTLAGTSVNAAELEIRSLVDGGQVFATTGLSRFEGRLESGATLGVYAPGLLDATIVNEPGSIIDVAGTLRFDGTNELLGGAITGTGTIDATSSSFVRIVGDTFINMPDGIVDLGDTFVLGGHVLTVFADKMTTGDPAVEGYEGTFDNFGTVFIGTLEPWRMGGVFEFDSNLSPPVLHGAQMVVTDGGIVRTVGTAGGLMTAPLKLLDGASVEIDTAGAVLELTNQGVYSGGAITGPGTLIQVGDLIVNGAVTIGPGVYDWDGTGAGSTLDVRAAGALTIDTQLLDPRNTFLRNRGTLDVTNRTVQGDPAPWLMAGLLQAHGGSVIAGSEMILDSGGVLQLVPDNGPVSFNAPLRVESGGQVQMASFGAPLTLNATTTLVGTSGTPTITGDGDLTTTGDIEVYGNAHIDCALFDWDGSGSVSTTTVHSGSSLLVELEHFSAAFGFDRMGGTIVLEPGASLRVLQDDTEWEMSGRLTLADGSSVEGVDLRNTGCVEGAGDFWFMNVDSSGTFAPRGDVHVVSGNYTQTANGTFDVTIAGPLPNLGYGRLIASGAGGGGAAILDGTLRARISGGYVPTVGAVFEIIDADGVTGTFSSVDAPGFSVTYLADRVLLVFVGPLPCAADVDGDDVVGFGDLLAVLSTWGPCPGCDADVNGDCAVDFDDLLSVLSAWGGCP